MTDGKNRVYETPGINDDPMVAEREEYLDKLRRKSAALAEVLELAGDERERAKESAEKLIAAAEKVAWEEVSHRSGHLESKLLDEAVKGANVDPAVLDEWAERESKMAVAYKQVIVDQSEGKLKDKSITAPQLTPEQTKVVEAGLEEAKRASLEEVDSYLPMMRSDVAEHVMSDDAVKVVEDELSKELAEEENPEVSKEYEAYAQNSDEHKDGVRPYINKDDTVTCVAEDTRSKEISDEEPFTPDQLEVVKAAFKESDKHPFRGVYLTHRDLPAAQPPSIPLPPFLENCVFDEEKQLFKRPNPDMVDGCEYFKVTLWAPGGSGPKSVTPWPGFQATIPVEPDYVKVEQPVKEARKLEVTKPLIQQAMESAFSEAHEAASFYGCNTLVVVLDSAGSYQFKYQGMLPKQIVDIMLKIATYINSVQPDPVQTLAPAPHESVTKD